jgi:hypothetical protein
VPNWSTSHDAAEGSFSMMIATDIEQGAPRWFEQGAHVRVACLRSLTLVSPGRDGEG